jgi:two-component system, OmpR family, sensor histidine kinase ChvG
MNLRWQLCTVSLLLLALPWAGCQFVREMEGTLRQGQEKSLQASTQSIAAVLRNRPELIYPYPDRLTATIDPRTSIYATATTQPVIVDGYDDGWEDILPIRFTSQLGNSELAVSYRAVTRGDRLYLLLNVEDPEVVYHNPGLSREPNGDRLKIQTWQDNRRQDYVIATAAPGRVKAKFDSTIMRFSNAGRIRGQWQDSSNGYTLELEIPVAITGGRLGFHIINVTGREGEKFDHAGNTAPLDSSAPPWMIYAPTALTSAITPFLAAGQQLEIIDQYRWRIADSDNNPIPDTTDDAKTEKTFWLLRWLYRWILADESQARAAPKRQYGTATGIEIDTALGGLPGQQRYIDTGGKTRTVLAAAVPVFNDNSVIGAVRIRQGSEEYLSLTDQAFSRLLSYSLTALGIGIFGLLGYASVLSWRIGSLNRAVANAVHTDGSVADGFPSSQAPDEIGELSRSYGELLARVRQNNDYLRTLSRKLSHELRTPIAVIRTSLENLEQESTAESADAPYISRAREGLDRLSKILNAMSEANSLEHSIKSNELDQVDLVPLLQQLFASYVEIYPQHQLSVALPDSCAMVMASPELLAQALDKCVDNAASFCPEGGSISLTLAEKEQQWLIQLSNDGPPLPANMRGQLFDSMVSVRERPDDALHLGLGLHIVRLICDFHDAVVTIDNRDDATGVICTLALNKSMT